MNKIRRCEESIGANLSYTIIAEGVITIETDNENVEKNAEDTKSDVGQYFTPRSPITAMVECSS